ncbi:hypothetical protein APUTEX25_005692 [Auxenochlorella protothecoides]|uniref:RING-type domain-containing protein n=1 Tax=Auxenochlorella protothecoides TaxID=3075 RepID=A0A3M7L0T1_AUXPR|nr:hypothetical protein APUTEX25_005692 [Auxenochlorella protothecoides]|eukprot:RMZ55066.1 hypothetical protein APUTEX25_005692 [Auxenochlorella protothecoides]
MNANSSPFWFRIPCPPSGRDRSRTLHSGSGVGGSTAGSIDSTDDEDCLDHTTIFRDFRRVMRESLSADLPSGERIAALCARAEQQVRFSHLLLTQAPKSEYSVLAPDPSEIAEGAVHDAEAALKLAPTCAAAQRLRAEALELVRRYEEAAHVAPPHPAPAREQGTLCPSSAASSVSLAASSLASAAAAVADMRGSDSTPLPQDLLSDLECPLCLKLLYRPVTTPCGHSFCQACLPRCLDHTSRCPTCRTPMNATHAPAISITLQSLLERCFAKELAERAREEQEERVALESRMPLFVMSYLLPGEHLSLNIFEPRYRLMVRRCMQGSRRFAMTSRRHPGRASDELCSAACEVEITECVAQPDGRFGIHVVGRRRLRLQGVQDIDGLLYTTPSDLRDGATSEPPSPELRARVAEVERRAQAWIDRLQELVESKPGLRALLDAASDRPEPGDHEALSFWAVRLSGQLYSCVARAGLVVRLSDNPARYRREIMEMESTLERLTLASSLLFAAQKKIMGGCCIS